MNFSQILHRKDFLFFSAIIFVSLFLRIYNLSHVPPSPSLDEVSIGYNAYSILHTGKDEYGMSFPILLRAYDDYRPALYVYLVIPFIALMGLTVEAVRLPSVMLSLITIITAYFLSKELFHKGMNEKNPYVPLSFLPYVVMLLLAISPWHIYLSRLGHEVNLGLTVTVLGIYFFIKAVHTQKIFIPLSLSAIFFGLSFYSYQSQKIIVPVLVLALGLLFVHKLLRHTPEFFLVLGVGTVIILPAVFVSFSETGLTRYEATTVFTPNHPLRYERLMKFVQAKEQNDMVGQVIYNRRFNDAAIFISQYTDHFDPAWLFWFGEKESHKVPYLGLLYLWEMPFLLLGLFVLMKLHVSWRIKIFIIIWILSSPLAASITTGAPHAMRSFTFIPILQVTTALGVLYVYTLVKRFIPSAILFVVFGALVTGSVIYFSRHYFVTFPRLHSDSFQYALSIALKDILTSYPSEEIVISNQGHLSQSYMFYLFYSRYDPAKYLQAGGTKSGGFNERHVIENVTFRPISLEKEKSKTLLLGNTSDFPYGELGIKQYELKNGEKAIILLRR